MTAVGLFAGRGDIVLALGLALLVGVLAGWWMRGIKESIVKRFTKQ